MEELVLPEISRNEAEIEKIRAAYALNVCAVSVSQIVDYNDQYILDQEYENTLNNLNLEKMPKDEAFLKILTETLNVVTFFRIYNEKKEQIEERYQQKVKSAIWSAVPNLAFIVSSGGQGGIYALIASLVTEVGLGYMNYRKTKAENDIEYKSNLVELQYTAIEQLNAIRTELFVTSWRIAEKYDFPDSYRLTENQINQYNDILMDPNIMRRFNRLYSIRENFIAYPPFWYYLGNAANLIAASDNTVYTEEYRTYYRGIAQNAYEYYLKLNEEFSVLRNDEIVSACALEYCDLLPEDEIVKKAELLNIAVKWSGNKNDIIQLCAFGFLKMEMYDASEILFQKLVNEKYCEEFNAQVLSSIFAHYYFDKTGESIELKHSLLVQQVPSTILFPLPIKENEDKNQTELWDVYIKGQVNSLSASSERIMDNYFEGFNFRLNKLLLNFDRTVDYPDSMFLTGGKEERENEAQRVFSRPLIISDYISSIEEINYPIVLVDTLNEMLNGLRHIPFLKLEKCVEILESKIAENSDNFERLQECINTRNITYETYQMVFEPITFDYLVSDFAKEVNKQMEEYVFTANDMKDIINIEIVMGNFVEKNNVKFFERDSYDEKERIRSWFTIDPSVVGKTAISVKKEKDNRQKIEELIRAKLPYLILDTDKIKVYFPGDSEFDKYFAQTANILSSRMTKTNLKSQTIAVIDELNGLSCDLIFTYNSLVPCYAHTLLPNISYKFVRYDTLKSQLIIGGVTYNNKYVDVLKLARCIEDISNAKEVMYGLGDGKNESFGTKESNIASEEELPKSPHEKSKIQMIKKCQKCGGLVMSDASFCTNCGSGDLILVPNINNIQFE